MAIDWWRPSWPIRPCVSDGLGHVCGDIVAELSESTKRVIMAILMGFKSL